MSIAGLMMSMALACAAVALVIYPLLRPSIPKSNHGRREQLDRVQAYYARVLTNIRDLDEDFSTDKISEADYRQEREVWVQRGIRLLRAQDQIHAQNPPDDQQIDRAIEAAVRAQREEAGPSC